MATVTKTTVEVTIGQYQYRAELDGNRIELFRDGVSAGPAVWNGGKIEDFPDVLCEDARDALTEAIKANLGKAWRSGPGNSTEDLVPTTSPAEQVAPKPQDAANQGQMGNQTDGPARQGEAEVGTGGPGFDPNSGEVGGQAMAPHRRAVGDGFKKSAGQEKQAH